MTGRLPRELADEVVGSLLELFRNDPVALRLTVVWDIRQWRQQSLLVCNLHLFMFFKISADMHDPLCNAFKILAAEPKPIFLSV